MLLILPELYNLLTFSWHPIGIIFLMNNLPSQQTTFLLRVWRSSSEWRIFSLKTRWLEREMVFQTLRRWWSWSQQYGTPVSTWRGGCNRRKPIKISLRMLHLCPIREAFFIILALKKAQFSPECGIEPKNQWNSLLKEKWNETKQTAYPFCRSSSCPVHPGLRVQRQHRQD